MSSNKTGFLTPFCLVCLIAGNASGIESFVEVFDGSGEFASFDGELIGFHNPDWNRFGDGVFSEFGYQIVNEPPMIDDAESDVLWRNLEGDGSFTMRLELDDLELSGPNESHGQSGSMNLFYF